MSRDRSANIVHAHKVYQLLKPARDIHNRLDDNTINLMHAALGLAGESGELVDIIKKHIVYQRRGAVLDKEKILDEAGDVLFYLQAILIAAGYTVADAQEANINKVNARYPNGYSDRAAHAREDED